MLNYCYLTHHIMKGHSRKTSVSNATLKDAIKALNYIVDNYELGKLTVENGTYKAFKKSVGVITCEMARQNRQKKKTIRVDVTPDLEREEFLREQRKQHLDE